jgi:methylmalonyl-CoA mutase cobalamin-binding subunit
VVELVERAEILIASPRPRPVVALIGFLDQGNLGMGYLSAVLRQQGCDAAWIDVRDKPDAIATRLLELSPLVVGFSLIFQFFLPQYRKLAQRLRGAGVASHFTIGGHYASLCPQELLANFPEIEASCAMKAKRLWSSSSTGWTRARNGVTSTGSPI